MEIRYGAGGKPMVVQPVQEIAETKNEKQEILQEILVHNPNEEDDDGFDEEVGGDDGC